MNQVLYTIRVIKSQIQVVVKIDILIFSQDK